MQQIDPFPNPLFDNNMFVNKHKCIFIVLTVFYYYLFILFYIILSICCHAYFTDVICKNKIALKKSDYNIYLIELSSQLIKYYI